MAVIDDMAVEIVAVIDVAVVVEIVAVVEIADVVSVVDVSGAAKVEAYTPCTSPNIDDVFDSVKVSG